MLTKEKIDRINKLAKKKKITDLSEEEQEEQLMLRTEYLESFRKNFREQLDSIEIVDDLQCNNKKTKGEEKMKKEDVKKDVNVGYNAAEKLEIKTTGEAVGENHSYINAERLEERNEDQEHEFMANEGREK